jgi:hypothetical protein
MSIVEPLGPSQAANPTSPPAPSAEHLAKKHDARCTIQPQRSARSPSECQYPSDQHRSVVAVLNKLVEQQVHFLLHTEHVRSLALLDLVIADPPPAVLRLALSRDSLCGPIRSTAESADDALVPPRLLVVALLSF